MCHQKHQILAIYTALYVEYGVVSVMILLVGPSLTSLCHTLFWKVPS